MSFVAIDHPSLSCVDLANMTKWYSEAFGMQVIARNDTGRRGVLIGFDDSMFGRTMLELTEAKEDGPKVNSIGRSAPGWRHVAVRVSDFDTAYERLKILNVSFTTDPHEAMGGGRTVLFRDPEGNELQVVERQYKR
jgi:catechol 2,3-dioxygenase-like lactoylglutathione lyase family enzyme